MLHTHSTHTTCVAGNFEHFQDSSKFNPCSHVWARFLRGLSLVEHTMKASASAKDSGLFVPNGSVIESSRTSSSKGRRGSDVR